MRLCSDFGLTQGGLESRHTLTAFAYLFHDMSCRQSMIIGSNQEARSNEPRIISISIHLQQREYHINDPG